MAIWEEFDAERGPAELARAREWRARRFDAGFGWISGPVAYGGRGLTATHERVYAGLEAGYDVPSQILFKLAPVVAPILVEYGGEALAAGFAAGLARGDHIACELFSEPEAGSDLASVRCRAEPAGDGWVLNGQKVWTSDADIASVGLVLARTAPGGDGRAKHAGLTTFLLDMRAPGVTVRPLRQMTGGAAFNEVFLTGAVVPDSHRVGPVGGGWRVARATLALERALVGQGHGRGGVGIADGSRLIALARHAGLAGDPLIRQELAAVYSGFRVAALFNRRMAATGGDGTERVAAKLALGQNMRRASHLLGRLLGPRLTADSGEWGTYAWTAFVLGEPGVHIAVGTDETIRTLIAERLLGLPREPEVSRPPAP